MADNLIVITQLQDLTVITYGGAVTAVQVSGCTDAFIPLVRGTHTFTVCVSSSSSIDLCLTVDNGFTQTNESASAPQCPTITNIVQVWNGFDNDTTVTFTLRADGPFDLDVSNVGDAGAAITSSPGGISCPSDCTESYAKDTAVSLTATPSAGFKFVNWTVDDPLLGLGPFSANPLALTMDRNWAITANYIDEVVVVGGAGNAAALSSGPLVVVEAIPAPMNYLVGVVCP